jgi:hypothetical protein
MYRRHRAGLLPDHLMEHRAPALHAASSAELGALTASNAQSGTAARPVALFVMGMARSGTSALTRALSLCGGTLPAGMAGANSGNPLGYWEPRASNVLNDAIMQRHRSSWLDPTLRLQAEDAFDAKENAGCIAKIQAFLNTLPDAPLVVIKDPRITALSGLWFEATRLAGFDIATVIAVRHPQEVVASLAARSGVSPELSSALWLKYNLLAERQTRALPRVFVEYPNLLDNWRLEIKRISTALAIDLNARDEGAVDEFLKPDQRRQRHCGPVTEPFGTDWISAVYETLHAAARDEPCDGSALDRVFEAYRASEYGFRTAFEDSHRFQKLNRLLRPSIQKLIYEVLAMVHRRRGTWA